jgi:erythromycin esterase
MLALGAVAFACATRHGGTTQPAANVSQPETDREVAWLRAHALPLRTTVERDDDFADLEPLRETLGRARVVVLGEADHGDGTTFVVKTRLVRFLHQRLGYDVLAFESGFYECWKAWQQIEAGKDPAAAFRDSVFRVWTVSRQVQPLIDDFARAARSPRPLVLAGFDPQFTGANSALFLDDLKRTAAAAGVPRERFTERFAASLANLVDGRYEEGEKPEPAAREELLAVLAEVQTRLHGDAATAVPERDFWIRLLAGLRQLTASSWATDWSKPLLEDTVNYPVRDRVMGEHLTWLARERFPRQKIVVWMHSFHAARGLDGVATSRADLNRLWRTLQPAGAVAHAELGDEIYTVGVLAHHGQRRFANLKVPPKDIPPASPGSLEDLFHRTGDELAFLDLRHTRGQPRWLLAPLLARPSNYEPMRARWRQVFDGLLFIDAMEPSEKAPAPAATPSPSPS